MAARVGAIVSMTASRALATMTRSGGMQYRTLGRTGAKVSLIGIGGYHIGQPKDPRDGIAIIRAAIDNGVRFKDSSSCQSTVQRVRPSTLVIRKTLSR